MHPCTLYAFEVPQPIHQPLTPRGQIDKITPSRNPPNRPKMSGHPYTFLYNVPHTLPYPMNAPESTMHAPPSIPAAGNRPSPTVQPVGVRLSNIPKPDSPS